MTAHPRHFDADYDERATLRSGAQVALRLITPADKAGLAAGLARMSPRSRYLRFFTDKRRLSARELTYLTELDGEDHLAIGVARELPDGSHQGLGIGRFVRLSDRPDVAEAALVVIDEAQRQGVGRLLLERLMAAAGERGVRVFRSDVLAENEGMRRLVRALSPDATERAHRGVVTVEVPCVGANRTNRRSPWRPAWFGRAVEAGLSTIGVRL